MAAPLSAEEKIAASLGPLERRLYPTIPAWIAKCWYVALHGLGPVGFKPRLKSTAWTWLLGGGLLIVSLGLLWLMVRAFLLVFATVATLGIFVGRAMNEWRGRSESA